MREVGERDGGVLKPLKHALHALITTAVLTLGDGLHIPDYLAVILLHKSERANWYDDALRASMQMSHC